MVLITRRDTIKQRIASRRKVLAATSLGIFCLILPIILMSIDPLFLIVKYKLRIAKGTIVHDLLRNELKGVHISLYLFNITNAEAFLAGKDHKLKVQEVGPFTYQEYRTCEELVIDEDAGEVRYRPRYRIEFVPEESIADPKEFNVSMPNSSMLSTTALLSAYPVFIQSLYNSLVTQINSKPIINISVYDYLWGYDEPLVQVANKLVPGLVYFTKIGLLDRLFDREAEYRMVIGATEKDKFSVKSVTKYRRLKMWNKDDIDETTSTYKDSYEGAAYPTQMTPQTPVKLYRLGICRLFELQYTGTTTTEYGNEAFTYTFNKSTFSEKTLCDSKGFCPEGFMDISTCFYELPFGISRSHFQGMHPKLSERIEGFDSNETKYPNEFIVEPKIGLTLSSRVSLQLSMVLGNIDYNRQASVFSDLALPMVHVQVTHPELPEDTKYSLRLMYVVGPYLLLASEVTLLLIALLTFSYSARVLYMYWASDSGMAFETAVRDKGFNAELPLIRS